MTTRDDFHRHSNNTDILDAIPCIDNVFTLASKITGSIITDTTIYLFEGLNNDYNYEIRIRAGAEPAVTDVGVATFPMLVTAGGDATEAKQTQIIGYFDGIDKLVKWLRK